MDDDGPDSSLIEAYEATTYEGRDPETDRRWQVRIGARGPFCGPAAYVTSDNPGSRPLSPAENKRRRRRLKAELLQQFSEVYRGRSIADDGKWPVERGFWIRPVDRNRAVDIAQRWDQNAIVFVDAKGAAELVCC